MLSLRLPRRRARGFSLVELMVALVLGLIVAGAVLALVLAIIRSNRATLQSTRLNQELRATLSVVASDLRRARGVRDPLTSALLANNPVGAMSTADADCIVYGYEDAVDGPWHVIRLDNERVVLVGAGGTRPGDCTPANPVSTTQLGSDQIEVTALTFTPVTNTVAADPANEMVVREITITITGHLIDDDQSLATINRSMSQTVYVRSVGTGI